ncbi:MAG TPA: hypothetical protein VLA90_04990 [Actinomycetota bacterium]|nr:hypothetical protein [Actinomycetota bacterium]
MTRVVCSGCGAACGWRCDSPGVIAALEDVGWGQSLPATDPGHFSVDGCH